MRSKVLAAVCWISVALSILRCSSESTNEQSGGNGGYAAVGGSGGAEAASGGSTTGGTGATGGVGASGGTAGTGGNIDSGNDAPAPTCTDGVKNGNEIDVDCGGGCLCQNGQPCGGPGDCVSSICTAGKCQPPNCTDSLKNGSESDVDCGGVACPKCDDLKACGAPTDCKSSVCTANICQAPLCNDKTANGDETDVDCGGSTCTARCDDGLACVAASDCKSSICQAQKCVAATCTDQVKNGSETDVDCGGSCGACNDGLVCGNAADCKSGVCVASGADAGAPKTCQAPTCADGVTNGSETDVDCGGATCVGLGKTCADTKACAAASDCASGVCAGSKCLTPTCSDQVKNGSESDTDCGGTVCPLCKTGGTCNTGADCVAGGCNTGLCSGWSKRFGTTGVEAAFAVAIDSQGAIVLGGVFTGSLSFGGPTLTSGGAGDGFVVKLARTGEHIWTRQLKGAGADGIQGVAIDSNDDVLVTGNAGTADIGGPTLTSQGAQDVLIAKLKGSDGSHLWSKLVGGTTTDQVSAIAVDSAGNAIVVGWSTSPALNLGGTVFTGQGSFDAFVAKYSGTNGAHVWSQAFGGVGVDGLLGVATDANDDVLVTGRFQGTVSFGGTALPSNGFADIVTAKYAKADGSHIWSNSHGGSNDDNGRSVVADGAGNAVMIGFRTGGVDLGGGTLTGYGSTDLALASYGSANGAHQWSIGPGGSGLDSCTDVALDGSSLIAIGGYRSANLDFGGGALPGSAVTSTFVVKVSASTGVPAASRAFVATTADSAAYSVAVNPQTHAIVIVGSLAGTLDLDGTQYTTLGVEDVFVVSTPPL